jgi:hypothetical protein
MVLIGRVQLVVVLLEQLVTLPMVPMVPMVPVGLRQRR